MLSVAVNFVKTEIKYKKNIRNDNTYIKKMIYKKHQLEHLPSIRKSAYVINAVRCCYFIKKCIKIKLILNKLNLTANST